MGSTMEKRTPQKPEQLRGTAREAWVDCGKILGSLLIALLHSQETFEHTSWELNMASVAVTFLLFLAGYTAYASARRYYERPGRPPLFYEILRRLKGILFPYALAIFITVTLQNHGFRLETYCETLLGFNVSIGAYYVFVYCQLTALSPVLFLLIRRLNVCARRWRVLGQIALIAFLLLFSYFSVNYTYMLPTFPAGRMLFGGSFLVTYYLGMLFASYLATRTKTIPIRKGIAALAWFLLCCGCVAVMNRVGFNMDALIGYAFGPGYSPAGLTLTVYCICLVGCVYSLCTWMQTSQMLLLNRMVSGWAWCGQFAMYMYLYHRLLQSYVVPLFAVENPIFMRAIYFTSILAFPIAGGWLWKRAKRFVLTVPDSV